MGRMYNLPIQPSSHHHPTIIPPSSHQDPTMLVENINKFLFVVIIGAVIVVTGAILGLGLMHILSDVVNWGLGG